MELTLFAEDEEGRYLLRPVALNSYRWARAARGEGADVAVPDADYLQQIRRRLDERKLRDYGYSGAAADIDDATIAVAVMGGLVSNTAFLDIVDDLLVRAACLCCYYTAARSRAEDAEQQIRTLLGYFSQESYEQSNAFYRLLCGLLRDIVPAEADVIAHHEARGPQDPAAETPGEDELAARVATATLNRLRGVCAVYTRHTPPSLLYAATQGSGWTETGLLGGAGLALCVYSTLEGRKALRRLGKICKAAGLTLTTRIATSVGFEFFCLRHKQRVYVLEVHPAPSQRDTGAPAAGLPEFWPCVAKLAKPRR